MVDVEHERRLTRMEDLAQSNARRLEELLRRLDNLDDLSSSVKVMAVREEAVENDVKEIKSALKAIAKKPGQRWEGLVDKMIMTIAAAIIGFIMAQIGF